MSTASLVIVVVALVFRAEPRLPAFCITFGLVGALIAGTTIVFAHSYREGLWQPKVYRPASVQDTPQSLGQLRYRLRLDRPQFLGDYQFTPFGSGFLVTDSSRVIAHDGSTGAAIWEASAVPGENYSWGDVAVSWNADTGVNVVAFRVKSALVGIDGASGKVLWRRYFDNDINNVVGGHAGLAVVTSGHVISVDPLTGRSRWSSENSCQRVEIGWSQVALSNCRTSPLLIDAATGEKIPVTGVPSEEDLEPAGAYFATPHEREKPSEVYVVDRSGAVVDHADNAARQSDLHNGFVLLIQNGQIVLRNIRAHTARPLPLTRKFEPRLEIPLRSTWVGDKLVMVRNFRELTLLSPQNLTVTPIQFPCMGSQLWTTSAVPGAVTFFCQDSYHRVPDEVVGFAPADR